MESTNQLTVDNFFIYRPLFTGHKTYVFLSRMCFYSQVLNVERCTSWGNLHSHYITQRILNGGLQLNLH